MSERNDRVEVFTVPTATLLAFAAAVFFGVTGRFAEALLALAVVFLAVAVVPNEERDE